MCCGRIETGAKSKPPEPLIVHFQRVSRLPCQPKCSDAHRRPLRRKIQRHRGMALTHMKQPFFHEEPHAIIVRSCKSTQRSRA